MKSEKMLFVAALGVAGLLLGDSAPAAAQGEPPTPAWVTRYDGPGNGADTASDVALDGAGNVYVTGRSNSSRNGLGYDYATQVRQGRQTDLGGPI